MCVGMDIMSRTYVYNYTYRPKLPLSDSLQGSESCIDVAFLQGSELSLMKFKLS